MKTARLQFFSSGGILLGSLMGANFLNYLFNALLGRVLTLEEFSFVTLVNTLWFLLAIFFNSLTFVTNNRTAYLHARNGRKVAVGFKNFFLNRGFWIGLVLFVLWLFLIPLFSILFHTTNYLLLASLAPGILLGIFVAIYRGFFGGVFSFAKAGMIILTEAASKLLFAFGFIILGLKSYAYASIPLSIVVTFFVAFSFARKLPKATVSYEYKFPRKLLFATLLTVFGSTAFLSIDLLLTRHFLSERESGAYALLSLVGKMQYFLGSLLSPFIITFASHDTGRRKNSAKNFYKLFGGSVALLSIGLFTLSVFGREIVPLLFGEKSTLIVQYLFPYLTAITFFTIASAFSTYHLAKQQYIFAYNGIFTSLLTAYGIFFFHQNIGQVTTVMLSTSYIYLFLTTLLHVFYKDVSPYIEKQDIYDVYTVNPDEQKKLSVSICVPAFNEEKNIANILKGLITQETNWVEINKIIVVSSACTDRTNKIVEDFAKHRSDKVSLICEKERNGKASAINTFLSHTKDEVVVVQSADTIPLKDTIEKLCLPFLTNKQIGMTGGAPIPLNDKRTFLGFVIHTWWWFHRHIPRFGEIIAFRNILPQLSSRTAVDEAYIQAQFIKRGYKIVHVDQARIRNKGSENFADIVRQRRRIYNGHINLQDEEHIHISTMTKSSLKLLLFEYKMYGLSHFVWLLGGIGIEIWARILGYYDRYFKRVNPVRWEIAKSTKDLSKGGVNIS